MKWEIETRKLEECGTGGETKWRLEKGTEGQERTNDKNKDLPDNKNIKKKKERC